MKAKGASLKVAEQPIDTSTAAGKAFLDMLGMFAEFETNLRKGGRTKRSTMTSSSNNSIAKKARAKAEADFATWLMMAKLGSFDDLPPKAQSFLINYRTRLETMSEAESTALAVREVYGAYYSEMGGAGEPPEPKARTATSEGKGVRLQRRPKAQPRLSAARLSTRPMIRKSLPALLIFAGMVALIAAYRFLTQ